MSSIFITNIVGTNAYAVPTDDTELGAATSGLSTLLSGVAGLAFGDVSAWVTDSSIGVARELNAAVSNALYNGEICPSAAEIAAMTVAIEAALVADPDITSVNVQQVNIEDVPTGLPVAHASTHEEGGSDQVVPALHASRHQNGQADEISVAGLSGLLADGQTPLAHDLGGGEHNADTLAALNAKISDATLVDGGPVLSNLWADPSLTQPEDEEFDAAGILPGTFNVWNMTTGAPSAFSGGSPTAYINPPGLRVASHPASRRSWGFLQPEAASPLYYVYKAYFSFPPAGTPHVMWARLKFNQVLVPTATDGSIGIGIVGQSAGNPDNNNYIAAYLNFTSSGVRARFAGENGGVPLPVLQSTPLTAEGQALEYVAIHVFAPLYHVWVGTAGGNWIYLGNATAPAITPFYYGILTQNGSTIVPGAPLVAVDFMRFRLGDATFLF